MLAVSNTLPCPVDTPLSAVSRFPSPVGRPPSTVSRQPSAVSRLPVLVLFLILVVWFSGCMREQTQAFRTYHEKEGALADLWIQGGTVWNGLDTISRKADVLVRGDEIRYIGWVAPGKVRAKTVIDARGKVVCPGFIDTHAHGDPLETPEFANFLAQGVTTIFLGQDGASPEEDLGVWIEKASAAEPGVNIGMFAGHGTLRALSGIGYKPDPTETEILQMAGLLQKAMDQGAFGLSTGLEYTPGLYAPERELVELAKVVGKNKGLITSHMRNEDDEALDNSLRELLRQGRFCNVQASHLKAVYGKGAPRALEVLTLLDSARQANKPFSVTADVYPYTASYTGIGIVFPTWAKPPNEYASVVTQRREELLAYLKTKVQARNGPEATLFGTKPYAGQTLAQLAATQGKPFEEVLLDIGPGGASAAYFVMDEALQKRLLQDPFVMVCSDGSPTMRHPRGYGSFVKVIETYSLKQEAFSLGEAIRKMTGLPAQTMGLSNRGMLAPGKKADILVFDPSALRENTRYDDPFQLATGMDWVILNGNPAIAQGKIQNGRWGKMLRKAN